MLHILPKPQSFISGEGNYELTYYGKIVLELSCEPDIYPQALLLKDEIINSCGMELGITRGRSKDSAIVLRRNETMSEESYHLLIQVSGIVIEGGGDRGILYGIQTLRQIIRQSGSCIPVLEIHDYPIITNRGFYHDVTRGRIPTMASLKALADTLSFYKINQLQLYIEHSFMFEEFSEIWRDDTPITAEEILELDRYCQKIGVELVPSLSSFGHLYKLLRTKSYAHLCELPNAEQEAFSFVGRMEHHTLNITSEEGYELVVAMIEEYLPLFTSRKFNIGADETFDLGKGRNKALADQLGVEWLYLHHVNKLCNYLVERGYEPMFWGDIICGFPKMIKQLPKETICLNWGYSWNETEDNTRKLAEAGARQYVCPGTNGWNRLVNPMKLAYQNIKAMCSYGLKYGAIGVLNTDWGDYGHLNHPSNSIPGLIYGAEFSWNAEDVSFEQLNKGIARLQYGDQSEQVMEEIAAISTCASMNWDTAVQFMELKEQKAPEAAILALFQNPDLVDQMSAADALNDKLKSHVTALKNCFPYIMYSDKQALQAYIIAADGMSILNQIGRVILLHQQQSEVPMRNTKELAQRLENWYYYYKKLWRSVSRESELYRIEHVITWYADFLRELWEGV